MHDVDSPAVRLRVLQMGRRLAFPVPDALLALIFAAAALADFLTPEQMRHYPHRLLEVRDELAFSLFIEGGFLLSQATLVDIATRLRKRPPIWVVALIAVAVLLFSSNAWDTLRTAWQRGALFFFPLLLSLGERAMILWRMPGRSRVEKIAERALIGNRITTGIALLALMVAAMFLSMRFPVVEGTWVMLMAGALYFGIAAFDEWRVRGRRFAEKPRVLFGFDPIHINYLEPV